MRAGNRERAGLIAGINITPLTDVVLVLLVIFMIATPLLIRSEIKVNLPRAAAADAAAQKTIVVTIDSAGNLYVDGVRVALASLAPTLTDTLGKRPNAPVIIMGDRDVRYDLVVRVLEIARTSGVNKLSLAVEVKR
ncbi:MAG: biopolymer transporter ExbD [Spirochaetia bacterium]